MRYPDLYEFMNRRQMEISAEKNRVVKQVELARASNVTAKTMSRLMAGDNLPEPKSWPGLYRVFGPGFYTAIGHPELEPEEIDPDFLYLWRNRQIDPNVKEIYDHAIDRARAIKEKREQPIQNVRNVTVTS